MSRLWPHPPYAEDQTYSHTILWTHVLTRGVTFGTIVGTVVGGSIAALRQIPSLKPRLPTSMIPTLLLRSSGTGAAVATAIMCIGLPLRMRGKEEIEWQDRSWRLIENKGQVECDDWTYPSMAAGAVAYAIKGKGLGWRGLAGSVGLGSVAGMAGYMGWRYGINGGKFEETVV